MPSKESTTKVIAALRSVGKPMLVSQLVEVTGLTTNTVKSVLRERGHADPGYPARWRLATDVHLTRRLNTVKDKPPVAVPYLEGQDWVKKLNTVKTQKVLGCVADLADFASIYEGNPERLYKIVSEAATTLGSFAFDIQESMEGPDWFERLGGKIEEEL